MTPPLSYRLHVDLGGHVARAALADTIRVAALDAGLAVPGGVRGEGGTRQKEKAHQKKKNSNTLMFRITRNVFVLVSLTKSPKLEGRTKIQSCYSTL